jgi:hypothetical protein
MNLILEMQEFNNVNVRPIGVLTGQVGGAFFGGGSSFIPLEKKEPPKGDAHD